MKPIPTRLTRWITALTDPVTEHYVDRDFGRRRKLRYRPLAKEPYQSTRLPGAPVIKNGRKRSRFSIDVQAYVRPGLAIMLRTIRVNRPTTLACRERIRWLRMEAVLTGELLSRDHQGNEVRIPSGHYHLTDQPEYQHHYSEKTGCSYMILFFPAETLEQEVIPALVGPMRPRELTTQLKEILNEMLDCGLRGEMLTWYYHSALARLIYAHCGLNARFTPGVLEPDVRERMHQVRRMMQEDRRGRILPEHLESKMGMPLPSIQRSYQLAFSRTLFEDRIQQRMSEACQLLENTRKSVKLISQRAGYFSLPGFVFDFRKHMGMGPISYQRQFKAKAGANTALLPG